MHNPLESTWLFQYPAIGSLLASFSRHYEHPKGAWQSDSKRRDCFASLAMTILIAGFELLLFILAFALPISYADDLDPHYKFSGVKAPDSPYKNT